MTAAPDTFAEELALANRILAHEGVLDAFGHISVRHPRDASQYVISRSLGPERVTQADLQQFTLDGQQTGGDTRDAYAERAIHGALYAARPDVVAICHNHAPSIIPFGITDVPLRPTLHMASLMGAEASVWDIAADFGDTDMLVRTLDQGRSLARALGPRRTVLMRGHGCAVVGPSLREVVATCVYMELNARILLEALGTGRPVHYLSAAELDQASQVLTSPLVLERAWDTWRARVT